MKNIRRPINILTIVFVMLLASGTTAFSQMVKKYMMQETVCLTSNGPIYDVPNNMTLWVEWNNDRNMIKMADGTVWTYQGKDYSGVHHYQYSGNEYGISIPGTNYIEAMFTENYQQMQINYTFGLGQYAFPIQAKYSYCGEGR